MIAPPSRVARWPPSTSQPVPLLSSRLPICWLSHCIASRCLVPWSSSPLSSCLHLLLRPSRLVGGRVVLPGAPASLSPRCIGLSSRSCLLSRPRAPLLRQHFYSTPPPLTCHLASLNDSNWHVNGGIIRKRTPFGCMYYCAQKPAATKKTTISDHQCTYN